MLKQVILPLIALFFCRWNKFRSLCDYNKRLGVVLELTANLPPPQVIDRWLGEPVRALVVSTSLFLTNKKGYPVLAKMHQNIIRKFFRVIVVFFFKLYNVMFSILRQALIIFF